MKQCPKCGGQIPDGAKFCGACGYGFPQIPVAPQPEEPYRTPTPQPQRTPAPQAPRRQKKKKSHIGLIIGLIAGILVLAGAITAAVLLLGSKKTTEPGALFFRGDELWYADANGT